MAGSHPWLRRGWPVALVGASMFSCIGLCVGFPCFPTGIRFGMWVDQCPTTDLRLGARVQAHNLVRGDDVGRVEIWPWAQWLEGGGAHASVEQGELRRGVTTELSLLRNGEPVDGVRFVPTGEDYRYEVTLPELPDGDYVLRTDLATGFDRIAVDTKLAMYAPALVHVATDRPLYKPGQTVKLRAAVLREADGAPLDERPGRWTITSPDGTEMLAEKAEGGPWGVTATTFPLSGDAEHGTWRARYTSGSDHDEITFAVRPFQLPRMNLEVKGDEPWFGIGDTLTLTGVVTYASGAPVARAGVNVQLSNGKGRWPMPLAWEEPLTATTSPDGRFEVTVGRVPADLIETAELSAYVQAVDETGEVVTGGTRVVLAVDDLAVAAVTELDDGLVQGFNNRAYVRVTTPDGQPLRETALSITRPYDPTAEAIEVETDVDGVAALQIDPGAPVTVVDPAPPLRVRPLTPAEPLLQTATELSQPRSLSLPERRVTDRFVMQVGSCGYLTTGNRDVELSVRVDQGGGVEVIHRDDTLSRCVAGLARSMRFAAGDRRTFKLTVRVPDSLQPSLNWRYEDGLDSTPGELKTAMVGAGLRARRCFPRGSGSDGAVLAHVHWAVADGQRPVRFQVVNPPGHGLPAGAAACLQRELAGLALPEPVKGPRAGVATARLSVPRPPGQHKPQATTRTAYELEVAATRAGKELGRTRWVAGVGSIPHLRMRATPSLAKAGDTVEVQLFRGPSFHGVLPDELWLQHEGRSLVKGKVVDKKVSFLIPEGVEGFVEVSYSGARAVVFVEPVAPLSVALSTDQSVYRPGDEAQLTVTTKAGDAPGAAAVLLAGVDQSLGQLAPLLAPDDFGRVTVTVTSPRPAFESFDAKALSLGRVRGENAAQAAVLRVGQLGQGGAVRDAVYGNGEQLPAVEEVLSTNFYRALEAAVVKVRAWEGAAPEGETMQPATMVRLWNEALAGLRGEGAAAVDGYGRELTLDVLPDELLAQVDPRVVVADGKRLPEDVVSWPRYVAEEVGR